MGSCGFAALLAILLASALLPHPAASARVLPGEKPSSSEGASAPAAAAGSEKSGTGTKKGLAQSATAVQNPNTSKQQQEPPRPATARKNSSPPPSRVSQDKGQEESEAQVSAQPVPPNDGDKGISPSGGPGPASVTGQEGGSSTTPASQRKEEVEKCVNPIAECSIKGKLFACVLVSKNASLGTSVIVLNEGQNDITVNIDATSDISVDEKTLPLNLGKAMRGKVNIKYTKLNVADIKVIVGNDSCGLHIKQFQHFDWQQQFQQFAAYATRMNPIYGAYFFVFAVILVGAVCVCCKFSRRRHDAGVPYQQLEMGTQAPNSSGADNTTSTVDSWEDGWDDDWDDEEAPAKTSDKKPAGSVSANGLSLRSQTNSKDGWDVDWDD